MGWLHIVSDLAIAVAYFAIPASLGVFAIRRRDLPFAALVGLFVAFILACGSTHLVEAIIFWEPIYRFAGVLKFVTACVSLVTAFVLVKSLPALLALPGLQGVVTEQRDELERVGLLQAELSEARDTLERRSAEMTQRLRRIGSALSSSKAVACHWDADTGEVFWEIGFSESLHQAGIRNSGQLRTIGQVFTPPDAERLMAMVHATSKQSKAVDFEGSLAFDPSRRVRLSAAREPAADGQAPRMTGMFRLL